MTWESTRTQPLPHHPNIWILQYLNSLKLPIMFIFFVELRPGNYGH